MTIVDDIDAALVQAGLDHDLDPSVGYRCGWDYWISGQAVTDGCGIARTAHRLPVDLSRLPDGAVAIVDGAMTVAGLAGSIWRQCLIRPYDIRAGAGLDPFAVSSMAANCRRAEHLVSLIGHCPRDLAIYLDDLRLRDRVVFELMLAKDFKGAIAMRPTIVKDPWPTRVRKLWAKPEADYLPPFLVAVLYAELARLAVNQAGLIAMAFDKGIELSTRRFLPRVPLAAGPHQPPAIKRAIEMLPYQSIALSAPGTILQRGDTEAAAAWAAVCAMSLTAAAGQVGGIEMAPITPKQAKAIRKDFEASPAFWLEQREKHGWSRQNRPAATYWGLNWREHASVGLVEIMMTAHDWNRRFRPNGPNLASVSMRRLSWAIATISFAWVAESNPAAALWLLKQAQGKKKGDDVLPLTFGPFGVDDTLRAKSGDTLRRKAINLVADRPKPGALGYTARYQAHLWLNDRGDDIEHYREYQRDAIMGFYRVRGDVLPEVLRDPSRVPEEVVAILARRKGISPDHGGIRHNHPPLIMTQDAAAARGAQNYAMMISPISTDLLREVVIRSEKVKKRK